MRRSALWFVAIILSFQPLCFGQQKARTWTDVTGTYKTEATLVQKTDSAVTLRKADGQEITIPLAKLSAADVEYLNNDQPPSGAADAKGRTLSPAEIKTLGELALANNGSIEVENGEIVEIQMGAIKPDVLAKFRDLHTVKKFGTYLSYSTLKDGDLEVIGSMKNLEIIDLDACQIGGMEGLKAVANLPKLKRFVCGEGGISDAAVAVLKNSKSIRELELHSHTLSDAGVKDVATMANLKKLKLVTYIEHANTVTDAGVAHLSQLELLEMLELTGKNYTNACVDSIGKMPALKKLHLNSTMITAEGTVKLQKAKPDLMITDGPLSFSS